METEHAEEITVRESLVNESPRETVLTYGSDDGGEHMRLQFRCALFCLVAEMAATAAAKISFPSISFLF
ncbi:hypothetical protein TSUD_154330 [Trifolium subterraneum]|jgi:hypothetical protein|uniref:Uncharacterized protein n=1 Tax=Trifolium subterraneum TaxID=3900 RepID=A0A2Z6NQB2_TRISU|nr:hypothetical protein TSUD_154330 [Trifolium subterraneum]